MYLYIRFTPTGVGTTLKANAVGFDADRFTPTGVGTTRKGNSLCLPPIGSPPRAWGQRLPTPTCSVRTRFTPTGVGTTSSPSVSGSGHTVHPHGRGDNDGWSISSRCIRGSPPRAWGQLRAAVGRIVDIRFTPTGVGTTGCRQSRAPRRSVHPHGRGDNDFPAQSNRTEYGSPPRAWGQRRTICVRTLRRRFTPTGVGTTNVRSARISDLYGSPPRAWGQHTCLTSEPIHLLKFIVGQVRQKTSEISGAIWDADQLQTVQVDDLPLGLPTHAHFKALLRVG